MEDVPLLIEHFLRQFNAENDKQVKCFAPEVLDLLLSYDWPGNVRQLENIVERGVVLARSEQITLDLLPPELRKVDSSRSISRADKAVDLSRAVSDYERQLIESALKQAGGVQKRAARLLGVKPTTLNEKLKRFRARVEH